MNQLLSGLCMGYCHLDLVAIFTFLPLAFSLALLLSCNPCDHLDLAPI
jgi:hypothetical protein